MLNIIKRIVNQYHYSIASIKNRYPCKIIDIKDVCNFSKETIITYQAVTKLNVRKCSPKKILDDPILLEKFHPTDGVKLGFIAFGEILLKENISMDEARLLFNKIAKNMFENLQE